jgi:hypothetical protein
MLAGFYWWDLIPLVILLVVLLLLVGRFVGAGYAWMRHRLERRAE